MRFLRDNMGEALAFAVIAGLVILKIFLGID